METGDELISKVDMQWIADEGVKIYEEIKDKYDPAERGKFLAIDVDSKDVFLGNTSEEALMTAMHRYPDKVFYVVRIGFDTPEALIRSFFGVSA